MSRKEKLAKTYANLFVAIPRNDLTEWQSEKATDFLAGYAACEQDARGMEEAIEEMAYVVRTLKQMDECNFEYIDAVWNRVTKIKNEVLAKWKERGEWTDKIPHASVREFAEKLPTVEARNKESI